MSLPRGQQEWMLGNWPSSWVKARRVHAALGISKGVGGDMRPLVDSAVGLGLRICARSYHPISEFRRSLLLSFFRLCSALCLMHK